jgi:putative hemolysin
MDASPDPSNLLGLQLLLLFCLILINAFFAASEIAIVSVNKNKIKVLAQEGNKKAKLLLGLLDQPNKFLSTIQVAITLAGFLASASAATGMAGDIGEFLSKFGNPIRNPNSSYNSNCLSFFCNSCVGGTISKKNCFNTL